MFGCLRCQCVILTLHSTCHKTLFLLLPINWLIFLSFYLSQVCTRTHLHAPLPSLGDIMQNRKGKAMKMNMGINYSAPCVAFYKLKNEVQSVKKGKKCLFVPAAFGEVGTTIYESSLKWYSRAVFNNRSADFQCDDMHRCISAPNKIGAIQTWAPTECHTAQSSLLWD